MTRTRCLMGLSLVIAATGSSLAAENSLPKFPRNRSSWLNSPPITAETLKGKAALLVFYEED